MVLHFWLLPHTSEACISVQLHICLSMLTKTKKETSQFMGIESNLFNISESDYPSLDMMILNMHTEELS